MSTLSSQPREWEILPLAESTAEDFSANEPLPPQTTAKAKAAGHFFSDKLLLWGSSARLPTPAPAGEQLPAYAFKSPWQRRTGAAGADTPCAPALEHTNISSQPFPARAASYLPWLCQREHRLCHTHLDKHSLKPIS